MAKCRNNKKARKTAEIEAFEKLKSANDRFKGREDEMDENILKLRPEFSAIKTKYLNEENLKMVRGRVLKEAILIKLFICSIVS